MQYFLGASLVAQIVKNPPAMQDSIPGFDPLRKGWKKVGAWTTGFDPWVGKIPWRREWQLTPVFVPGESHRQRSLEGYSPWGHN